MRSLVSACAAVLFPSVACAADAPSTLPGRWLAESIDGGGVIDRVQTTLEVSADGGFYGHGGCNRYRGQLKRAEKGVAFGPAAATRMVCPPATMEQEIKFFRALGEVVDLAYDTATRKLTLWDAAGKPLVVLARMDESAQITITVPGVQSVGRNQVAYRCGGEAVIADYINAGEVSLVTLTRSNTFTVAANVLAASGVKYAGDALVWWVNGDEAALFDLTKGENDPGLTCTPDA